MMGLDLEFDCHAGGEAGTEGWAEPQTHQLLG